MTTQPQSPSPRPSNPAAILEALIARHGAELRAQAARHAPSAADVDDALQDAYVELLRYYHGPPGADALRYLMVCVKQRTWAIGARQRQRSHRLLAMTDLRDDPKALAVPDVEMTIPVREPQALAVGAGGVWLVEPGSDTVTRLDPQSGRVAARIHLRLPRPIAGERYFLPSAITVGAGSVWVSTERGYVAQIDPARNRIERMISTGLRPAGQLTVAGGSVWIAAQLDGLLRIDPRSGLPHGTGPIEAEGGARLSLGEVSGDGGTLWAAGAWAKQGTGGHDYALAGGKAVAVLDPRSQEVRRLVELPGELAIKATDDGRAWLADYDHAHAVYVLRASGGSPRLVARLRHGGTIVASLGRSLWVARPYRQLQRYVVPARALR